MAVNFAGAVLQRTYASDALGDGVRVVTAVVTATRSDADVVVVGITISQVSNMLPAELADYQDFVDLMDEEQTLTHDLVLLDDATP
jgi:hypothetical protein